MRKRQLCCSLMENVLQQKPRKKIFQEGRLKLHATAACWLTLQTFCGCSFDVNWLAAKILITMRQWLPVPIIMFETFVIKLWFNLKHIICIALCQWEMDKNLFFQIIDWGLLIFKGKFSSTIKNTITENAHSWFPVSSCLQAAVDLYLVAARAVTVFSQQKRQINEAFLK